MKLSERPNNEKKKKKKVPPREIITKVVAIVLAGLFLLSVCAAILPFGGFQIAATSFPENFDVRIGLMYGTGVTVGFETKATNGFNIGYVTEQNQYTSLWNVTDTVVSVTCDANLSKNGMSYSKTNTSPTIGGYHLELIQTFSNSAEVTSVLSNVNASLTNTGFSAFPAFVQGTYRVRVGNFASEEAAFAMQGLLSGYTTTIAKPCSTGVSVVNPATDVILFELEGNDSLLLALKPIQTGGETNYLQTPAKRFYKGIFAYKRYVTSEIDGVSVINILPLEDYVESVLPWEIGNSWHDEVQKAFAITVRSFTLSQMGRHRESYDFDLCNSTHCQAYLGVERINEKVTQAVQATKGMILQYQGEIASIYYSAISGGTTVSAEEAWGGESIPYLLGIATPWEKYNDYDKGTWTVEISPSELCNYLNSKGYSSLKQEIASITINQLAQNSTYVYSITFTDSSGNAVTVETSDKIRTVLGKYLYSANFVVTKGGTATPPETEISVITGDGTYCVANVEKAGIISKLGKDTVNTVNSQKVITSSGITEIGKTIVAKGDSTNFVFVGKGWGHGVGLSQYGAKDMADSGSSYAQILAAYFPGTSIMSYKDLK